MLSLYYSQFSLLYSSSGRVSIRPTAPFGTPKSFLFRPYLSHSSPPYRCFRFSNLAYVFMSFWLIMHTIGSYYTFADVPFDWANRLLAPFLGEGRNHFDRVGHYIIGFYAYPMAEWLLRRKLCRPALALFFSLFFIMSVAAAYEIIEWQYAVIDGGEAGLEVLGSQGDIWDAQKDMLADTLGALTSLVVFILTRPDKRLKTG